MKIILTHRQVITSKGKEYNKLSFIDPVTGETGDVWATKEDFEKYELPSDRFLSKDVLAKIIDVAEVTEAEFNQRGRLTNLS